MAPQHVCFDCVMFKTYMNKKVLLGVVVVTNVANIGVVDLKPTSEKALISKDDWNTPEIIKNLVSDFSLNKARFSRFIGVDLYTITNNDIFVNEIDILSFFVN